jgi:hypothetical protein
MSDVITAIRERLKAKLTDNDTFGTVKLSPPANSATLDSDEKALGFALPPLLRRIYLEIGNGGFGPGYGLIGISGGTPDDSGKTVPAYYRLFRSRRTEDQTWSWPEGLLVICHWGCSIYSCVDCLHPRFRMRVFDPNVHVDHDSWDNSFFEERTSFDDWIGAWADGVDLWEATYGENGVVRQILEKRENFVKKVGL